MGIALKFVVFYSLAKIKIKRNGTNQDTFLYNDQDDTEKLIAGDAL